MPPFSHDSARAPLGVRELAPALPLPQLAAANLPISASLASRLRGLAAARGFTLLELMIVITIILILLTLAAGRYQQSVIRAREAALKQNLFVMRQSIDQYTLDKLEAPQSLEDVVASGYLRSVPEDPMTKQRDWRLIYDDVLLSPEQRVTGIVDVKSNSDALSPFEHTPYSTW
jgi:general secretion pathway protein G